MLYIHAIDLRSETRRILDIAWLIFITKSAIEALAEFAILHLRKLFQFPISILIPQVERKPIQFSSSARLSFNILSRVSTSPNNLDQELRITFLP